MTQNEHCWRLYFFQGRLIYATGTLHRVRRWRRAIKRHVPKFQGIPVVTGEPWEYQLLSQSVTQSHINVAQAQEVIKLSLGEVLFSWIGDLTIRSDWSSSQRFSFKDNAALSLLLSSTQIEGVLQESQKLWKHWKRLELESLNPHISPTLQPSFQLNSGNIPPTLMNLSPFLTGRYTLWDIACYARRPVTMVTQFLLPWVQRGAISFEEIPDLPSPIRQTPPSPAPLAQHCPLIACIDDSPTVNECLANILEPAGYRVLKIQDPLSGMALLSKYKPDLIVMDLVMPTASGYDVCSFLRKTPIFQNTPIIILTSQSGLVDRTRAKLAGASDFLSKPPDPQTLLNLVRIHLQSVMSTPSSVTCQCQEDRP
uniref:Protein PatA n=1 Tax=Oscillatoriales cyanobacterium SpSt-402 TaxID=2282168 RepID=A0A832M2A8_9CYAN